MYRRCAKRLFDVLISLCSLPFLLPIFLLVALHIKMESRGPVFFRQTRCGRGEGTFTLLKFRSMKVDYAAEGKGFEPGSTRRITGVGTILRKTKMDEIPQIINVIKGDMSLVGPRPEVPAYIHLFPERWAVVRSVRPGITDPASVVFRNEEQLLANAVDPSVEYETKILPEKLDLYEKYVKEITFLGDMRIMVSTVYAVFFK